MSGLKGICQGLPAERSGPPENTDSTIGLVVRVVILSPMMIAKI
jgi:hypothetical protein